MSGASWESLPLNDSGTIRAWVVAGPLPSDPGRSGYKQDFLQAAGGEARAVPEEGQPVEGPAGKAATWQVALGDGAGVLDFVRQFGVNREVSGAAYAFCQLQTSEGREVTLNFRHNDGCRAWLNQELILDKPEPGTLDARAEPVKVRLKPGLNPLLCKVDQIGGEWGLSVSVLGADGKAAPGVSAAIGVSQPVKGRIFNAVFSTAPVVARTPAGERCLLEADLDSGGVTGATLRVSCPAWPEPVTRAVGDLPLGRSRAQVEIPVIVEAVAATVQVQWAGGNKVFEKVKLAAPKRWTVYLTQHTHTDIGYTRPQTEILPEHLRYIDYALDYCDQTDSYPDDARFRWTCETTWAVQEYLKRRPAAQLERLRKRVREGRIEVAGMLLNMAEIAPENGIASLLQPLREVKDALGTDIRTAMQNDVNGAAWCLVDYFQGIGIRYLTMGINKTRSLLPFDKPTVFWWESPSGKRILAYRSDHYMTANFWQINQGKVETFKPGVLSYLRSLEDRDYPFDRVGVQFSGYYTDNSPPSTVGSDVVKAWNEAYVWPKLRLSTAQEFLAYVEKEHPNDLEVHRQAWPDWWTDGFGSAARETAAAREMHTAMQINDSLLAMATILGATVSRETLARAAAVQEDLLFYDEHTYGAAESIDDPLAENTQVQWGEKGSYAWTAVKNATLLREEALGLVQEFLPRATVPTLAVINTLNWPRSGLVRVFIDHQILPHDKEFRLVDAATGETIPAQAQQTRAEGTYWGLWIKDVPPLGYKTVRIEVSAKPRVVPPEPEPPLVLENKYYRLTIDARKGAIQSWVDKATGRELVDETCEWGLGQCVYETLPKGRDFVREDFKRKPWRNVRVEKGANGPVWKSVWLAADLDGCADKNGVRAEIRLYEMEKRVELHYAMRKLPVSTAEAVYVAFPFKAPGSQIEYEGQGGTVIPGQGQIPGSASDWQTMQSYVSVRAGDGQILFGSDQAPLMQLGDFNLGKWMPVTRIDKPHVFSWVMNNYWFTNFRVSQEGEFRWVYYLTSLADAGRVAATRFGWGSRVPLVTRVMPATKQPGTDRPVSLSTLGLSDDNVLVVGARPAFSGDGVLFHVRELEGREVTLDRQRIATGAKILGADEVNVLGQVTREGIESLTVKPLEVRFVRLRLGR